MSLYLLYYLVSSLPAVLMISASLKAKVPARSTDLFGYRVGEVSVWILENPDRRHYIATGRNNDKTEVLETLRSAGVDPDTLDLHFYHINRMATGWHTSEPNCSLSSTRSLGGPILFQLKHRLRSPDATYMICSRPF